MWRLRVLNGRAEPEEVEVVDGLVIGRGRDCALRVLTDRASRRHARLTLRDDAVVLDDLESANGVTVNGRAVSRAELEDGDVVRLGGAEMLVEGPGSTPPTGVGTQSGVRVEGSLDTSSGVEAPDLLRLLSDDSLGATPLARVAAGVAAALTVDDVVILTRMTRGGPYRVVATHPPESAERPPVSRALLARAEVHREALLLSADVPELSGRQSVVARAADSAICSPIVSGDDVLGALYVERRRNWDALAREDLGVVAGFARAVAETLSAELLEARREAEEARLFASDDQPPGTPLLLGAAPSFLAVVDVCQRVAPLRTPVLFEGERGSGRRTLARAVHEGGAWANEQFVVVPCAALDAGREGPLLHGEVVGGTHRPGLLAHVGRGTVCLADVDRLSPPGQTAVRRALESRQVAPGTEHESVLRARVVATTSTPLAGTVSEAGFDHVLAALISPVRVHVPPLRDRPGDVELLARHFAELHGTAQGDGPVVVNASAMDVLTGYEFPGNVSELSALVALIVSVGTNGEIGARDIPHAVREAAQGGVARDLSLKEAERVAVRKALEATRGKRGAAAELLGVSWPTLTKKMRLYKLEDVGRN